MQYCALLFYAVSVFFIGSLKFIDSITLVNYTFYTYVWYAYHFAEIINISCWVVFIMQINTYSNASSFVQNDQNILREIVNDKIETIRSKERLILWFILTIFGMYLIVSIFTNVLTFAINWLDCSPYYDTVDWPSRCFRISDLHLRLFQFCSIIAVILIILKITFGVILLNKMKKNLYFFYLIKRNEIIVTIVLTSIITSWKAIYNYFNFLRVNDLKYSFLHRQTMKGEYLTVEIIICIIDIFLPMVAIAYNIRTVNFRKYLINLLKGVGLEYWYLRASIFLR